MYELCKQIFKGKYILILSYLVSNRQLSKENTIEHKHKSVRFSSFSLSQGFSSSYRFPSFMYTERDFRWKNKTLYTVVTDNVTNENGSFPVSWIRGAPWKPRIFYGHFLWRGNVTVFLLTKALPQSPWKLAKLHVRHLQIFWMKYFLNKIQ